MVHSNGMSSEDTCRTGWAACGGVEVIGLGKRLRKIQCVYFPHGEEAQSCPRVPPGTMSAAPSHALEAMRKSCGRIPRRIDSWAQSARDRMLALERVQTACWEVVSLPSRRVCRSSFKIDDPAISRGVVKGANTSSNPFSREQSAFSREALGLRLGLVV